MVTTTRHTKKPVEVFYSYAEADEPLCKELEKHLALLRQQGVVTEWHHCKIVGNLSGGGDPVAQVTHNTACFWWNGHLFCTA
jgi:hypothetical protein